MMRSTLITALLLSAAPLGAQCVTSAPNALPVVHWPGMVRGFNLTSTANHNIEDASKWGINLIRLQIFPRNRAQRWHKSLWDAWPMVLDTLEAGVKDAAAHHLYVVVDLHEPPVEGPQEGTPELWHDPDLAKSFCRAWADIARRLLPYRHSIYGYDLYNEPLDRSQQPRAPKEWAPIAQQIIQTIRSIDRETWIVFESGPGYTFNGLTDLKPFSDHRVIYSGHVYDPLDFTSQGTGGAKPPGTVHYRSRLAQPASQRGGGGSSDDRAVLQRVLSVPDRFQGKYHVPIFVGEFAVTRWAPHDEAVGWLRDAINLFEQHHWSWAYHVFREYNGWSLEDDDSPWKPGDPEPKPVNYTTDRAKVVKDGFALNRAH
jgi:endoglucanase